MIELVASFFGNESSRGSEKLKTWRKDLIKKGKISRAGNAVEKILDRQIDGTQTSRFPSLSFISVVSFNSYVGVRDVGKRRRIH